MAATKKNATPVTEKKEMAMAESVGTTVEKVETEETAKKTTAKAAKTTTAKKAATTKKAELKSELHIQFEDKSYSEVDLVKIAKDVWKYDLKKKVGDLASIELYVKPEENMAYYVMNKEFTGSFYI